MRRAALALVLLMALSGCGFRGVYSLPLPGAVGTGPDSWTVRVQLADALDLVPYSAVKVADATVGHVESIRLVDRRAEVVCRLEGSVHLPANASARLSQTSLLGEKFVQLAAPTSPQGELREGDVIPLSRTDTDATVEEVLGALALLLSGGGLQQLHTIATELSAALDGREATARDLLASLDTFTAALDRQKGDILRAVEHIDALAATVRAQQATLTRALAVMPSALAVLAEDRAQLTRLMTSLDGLGTVAVRTIRASKADLVANLQALRPTLTRLAEVGEVVPRTLEALITYPTADGVEKAYFGDYGNLALTIDTATTSLVQNFGGPTAGPVAQQAPAAPAPAPPTAHWLEGTTLDDLLMGRVR